MSANKTFYVLARGSYSDYRVLCVVNGGKKAAKDLAARVNAANSYYSDQVCVETLEAFDQDVQRVDILNLTSEIQDTGTAKDRGPTYRTEWPFDTLYGAPDLEWRWVRAPCHNGKGGRLEVWGTDHERVRKVFGERRAALLTDDALRARKESNGRR